jgi:hypothetical protein
VTPACDSGIIVLALPAPSHEYKASFTLLSPTALSLFPADTVTPNITTALTMPSYSPITVCRSDGLLEFSPKAGGNIKESNGPTEKQLDDTPTKDGVVDCYRKVELNEQKHVDWRRKLGGMTMHLLGGVNHQGALFLIVTTFVMISDGSHFSHVSNADLNSLRQDLHLRRLPRWLYIV